jgi:hypothetical protein
LVALMTTAVFALAGCGSHVAPTGIAGAASAAHGNAWMLPGSEE